MRGNDPKCDSMALMLVNWVHYVHSGINCDIHTWELIAASTRVMKEDNLTKQAWWVWQGSGLYWNGVENESNLAWMQQTFDRLGLA